MPDSSEKTRNHMDPDAAQFFGPVGYAITRWALVDRELFDLCRFALATSDEKMAVVFYRSPSLKDHLMLADALLRLSLSQRQRALWGDIFSLADRLLPFRNDLAHNPPMQIVQIVVTLNAPSDSPPIEPQQWWELRTENAKLLNKKKKAMRAKVADVIQHIGEVDHLLDLMWDLKNALPKRRKKRSPSSTPRSPQESGSKKKSGHTGVKRQPPPRSSQK
jgi:hypothetical protein